MKILVVDDELVSRKKMQRIMEGLGECVPAGNGPQAVTAFVQALKTSDPFDLVTLDVGMPDMDGLEVLFTLREQERNQCVPRDKRVKVLMVTAHADKDTVITSIQAGCDEYVVKPFDRVTILEKLLRLLSPARKACG